jgi:hypothetical protein
MSLPSDVIVCPSQFWNVVIFPHDEERERGRGREKDKDLDRRWYYTQGKAGKIRY